MKAGGRAKIVSHPALWPWAAEYVGEECKVLAAKENAAKVDTSDGPLWFANKHLRLDVHEQGAA